MPYRVRSPIREARMRAGLSQRQLARQIHVENVTISGWENGHYRPSPQRAVALCRALPGLTLDAIYLHSTCVHPCGPCPIHAGHGGQRPDSSPRKDLRRA